MSEKRDPKVWIKLKRGLVVEPKHRQKVGSAIWLYLMLIDMADWDTGLVDPYKDADIAADMSASVAWVRKQRRILEEYGYIKCQQLGAKGMRIALVKWVNPKGYDGKVKNVPGDPLSGTGSVTNVSLSKPQSDTQSVMESDTQSDTVLGSPSIIPRVMNQESGKDSATDAAPSEKKPKARRPKPFKLTEWSRLVLKESFGLNSYPAELAAVEGLPGSVTGPVGNILAAINEAKGTLMELKAVYAEHATQMQEAVAHSRSLSRIKSPETISQRITLARLTQQPKPAADPLDADEGLTRQLEEIKRRREAGSK